MTGKGVKVAVGSHGTHVSGIIHALAPDAELRGYAVFAGDDGNDALRESPEQPIIDAIHRAVKDGNQVINMSGGIDSPSSAPSPSASSTTSSRRPACRESRST